MPKRILVAVDGSETSRLALRKAIKLARTGRAKLRLVHVVDEFIFDSVSRPWPRAKDLLNAVRDSGRENLARMAALAIGEGLRVQTVLLEAIGKSAADAIVAQAASWPADLILMGTHGRRGVGQSALGTDANKVARTASIPVQFINTEPLAG